MDNAILGHSGAGIRTPGRWSTFHHRCSMTTTAEPSQRPSWDRPIVARGPRPIDPPESVRPLARPGRVPTVEEAIAAWLGARGFAPSTAAATHQHLESGRARGVARPTGHRHHRPAQRRGRRRLPPLPARPGWAEGNDGCLPWRTTFTPETRGQMRGPGRPDLDRVNVVTLRARARRLRWRPKSASRAMEDA
jgi:hypothetical protein